MSRKLELETLRERVESLEFQLETMREQRDKVADQRDKVAKQARAYERVLTYGATFGSDGAFVPDSYTSEVYLTHADDHIHTGNGARVEGVRVRIREY